MEATNTPKREKRTGSSAALRVLAGFLALVLLFSVVAAILVRVVKPQAKAVSIDLVESAYALLEKDDAYLNASVVERVGTLLSNVGVTPKSVSDYEQLASMYIGRGNYEEARYLYQQAAELIPKEEPTSLVNLYYRLGSVCVLCGDMPAAEDYYNRILDYGVSSELIHMLLAQVLLEQKKYADAAEQLAQYLLYEPDDVDNRTLYANALEVAGDYAGAAEQYEILAETAAETERYRDIARVSFQQQDYAAVIWSLTKYFESNEDTDGSLYCMRGMAQMWEGNADAAVSDLDRAEELGYEDKDGSLHYMRGMARMWQDDADAAVSDLDRAEALGYEDRDGSLHYMRGTAYLSLERYDAALADLNAALDAGYDAADCYAQLSLGSYLSEDYEATVSYGLLACEEAKEPNGECLQRIALSEMQLKEYDSAMTHLTESLSADPSLTMNHYFIATIHFLKEDFESAAVSYGAAVDSGVYVQECLYNRALCYLRLRKRDLATADLKRAAELTEDPEVTAAAKDILAQLGVRLP